MKISNRIQQMQESPLRKLVPFAQDAKKRGIKVYHLNIGQPDIETPAEFLANIKNFDEKVISYSFSQGDPKLISAVADYYQNRDINFTEKDILITNGGSEALLFALLGTCEEGDEILIPEPYYTNYNTIAKSAGVKVQPIQTSPENGFKIPAKNELQKLVTPRTKAILFSNPGNPTGAVYAREELEIIAELATENDLFVIADEVYSDFVYDEKFTSFMEMSGLEKQTIVVDSISKRFSACGARIGSIASKNEDLMANVLKLCQSRLCVPTLEQVGAIELFKIPRNYFEEVNEKYRLRRNTVYEKLIKIPGVKCQKPKGAFYIMATLPVDDAEDFVKWMLTDFNLDGETVMVAPAAAFYGTDGVGKNEIRIAYVLEKEKLNKAMDILAEGLANYPKSLLK